MARDPRAYLWDMRDAARHVRRFIAGASFAQYLADDMLRSAVERQMQNMGEALAQLARIDPALAARVRDHVQIIGFRNVLVHGYVTLNHGRVWDTLQIQLPGLQSDLEALLSELDPQGPP